MNQRTCALLATLLFASNTILAAYAETKPRQPGPGEIAVTQPGSYAEAGKTYVLTSDISSAMTPIFLGNNVTLDLNGHTVTFADGKYEHIPNYGFEEGMKHWDVTKAPGAKAVSTVVRPLIGKQFCSLPEGQEIVSEYITLPVANRSYYATCALSNSHGWEGRKVSLYVEDEKGNQVQCVFRGGRKPAIEGKIENQKAELGGGTIFTHLFYLPAGKYRLRVKAASGECQIDECDIRPALDAGIAVVGTVSPWATYSEVMEWSPCAFFDYNKKDTRCEPVDGIPIVKDEGTVTIKNGVVKAGYEQGARSWGIHSTAKNVTLVLENVKVVNSGVNTGTVQAAKATIKNCRLETDTPFIINRHDTSEMNVKLGKAVEIAFNEIIGGQGCLATGQGGADVHDNIFRNGQTVTNHYSISPGKGDKIYKNRFEPLVGSGIYIGSQNVELHDNVFEISSAPPNAEYRYDIYSTNAIRISDYNKGTCTGNKVYKNKIHIVGKEYPEFDGYNRGLTASSSATAVAAIRFTKTRSR